MVELSNKRYRSVQLSFIALELRFFGFIALELRFHFIIILLVYSAYKSGWLPQSRNLRSLGVSRALQMRNLCALNSDIERGRGK